MKGFIICFSHTIRLVKSSRQGLLIVCLYYNFNARVRNLVTRTVCLAKLKVESILHKGTRKGKHLRKSETQILQERRGVFQKYTKICENRSD